MNLKFFVGWANSFIVCPRGTRYEKLRMHTQRVQEPLRGKSVPTLRAPVHGAQFGRKIGDCGLSHLRETGASSLTRRRAISTACVVRSSPLVTNLAPQRLQLTALSLALDASFNGTSGWLGCGALPGCNGRAFDQSLKPRKRIFPIFLMAAIALCLDDDYPVIGNAPVSQLPEFLLAVIRQRRRIDIEAQMDRSRDLVDILPARTLRPDRMQLDLVIGDRNVIGYFKHQL